MSPIINRPYLPENELLCHPLGFIQFLSKIYHMPDLSHTRGIQGKAGAPLSCADGVSLLQAPQ